MIRMCEIMRMGNINKGSVIELISKEEKSLFFLKKGTVKIVDTTNNSVKYIVKKGNIFGELALYNKDYAHQEQAIALEDCIVCYIEADRMERILEKHESE